MDPNKTRRSQNRPWLIDEQARLPIGKHPP